MITVVTIINIYYWVHLPACTLTGSKWQLHYSLNPGHVTKYIDLITILKFEVLFLFSYSISISW